MHTDGTPHGLFKLQGKAHVAFKEQLLRSFKMAKENLVHLLLLSDLVTGPKGLDRQKASQVGHAACKALGLHTMCHMIKVGDGYSEGVLVNSWKPACSLLQLRLPQKSICAFKLSSFLCAVAGPDNCWVYKL